MRASAVIAASLAGLIAGAVSVRAADLPVEPYGGGYGGYGMCCRAVYQPVPQVVVYDDQPGVVIRRWWLPPWRNRHYYPRGAVHLKNRSPNPRRHRASRAKPPPAPYYFRYWTNQQAYSAPPIGPNVVPLPRRPRPYPYRQSPPPVAAP